MANSATKKLKTEAKSAIRAGFTERGWRALPRDAATFVAPESVVPPPLTLHWNLAVDSYHYGGALFTGNARVRSEEVTEILLGFGRPTSPYRFDKWPWEDYARLSYDVDWVSAGALVDPVKQNYHKWLVGDQEELQPAVADFFSLIDGALGSWAQNRRTVTMVLDNHAAMLGEKFVHPIFVRTVPVLALLHDRPKLARSLIGCYEVGGGDAPDRIATFERELAARFPEYGPLQRST